MSYRTLTLVAVAVSLEVLAQLSFKRGALAAFEARVRTGTVGYLRRVLRQPWIWSGILAYLLEFVVAVAVLSVAPLSVVFPLFSLSYCGVAIASHTLLGERLGVRNVAAIAFITAGAAIVSTSVA